LNTDAATGDLSFDLPHLMDALAAQRPIFHSEADFQHALAWEIHTPFGTSKRVRLN
jgi:hypothetical protein